MKIRIEKKGERYLVFFSDDEKEVKGIFLTWSELRKLEANIQEIVEYHNDQAGDDI